ncbi:raffinose synthase Sip1 [Xylariaceae sp. FL0016]|nr:raffinose synthase Sip1 [Xylariaceae sp. FL0016]
MHTSLIVYPPLGQVTQVRSECITFTVVFDGPHLDEHSPWEVALWYSSDDRDWAETSLTPVSEVDRPISLGHPYPSANTFRVAVNSTALVKYTVKFRVVQDQSWRWARDETGLGDGLVIVNMETNPHRWSESLSDIIHGLNPDLRVMSVVSQAPRTRLWTVKADVDPADEHHSAYSEVQLGVPFGAFVRYFALVRHANPWLGPRHGKTQLNLDKDALMCSFLSPSGKHLVLLGVSGVNDTMTMLKGMGSAQVTIQIRNDASTKSSGLLLAALGNDFESAIAAVMYHARTVMMSYTLGNDFSKQVEEAGDDVKPEWYENWYDGLGYCTWNSLGKDLTEDKLLAAVESLAQNNINITSLIIDDNWQNIDRRSKSPFRQGWKDFEADPAAFPNGLMQAISKIRSNHSSIQHIAVWHALLGYWGGISPDGPLAQKYETQVVERDDSDISGSMTVIAKGDVDRFYGDFYQFLSSCGIDAVKTDVQYMLDTLASAKDRRSLTGTYLDAWAIAALRHFSIKAISCMSQTPQILFHQQLPRNRPMMLVRNSDDFFPDVPSAHPWHIWANAHNALLTQHLNALPDWDMFQTDHEFAKYHAAARCISGGPIYITDIPGHHDMDLIKQMTGVTPRGKTVVLRPSVLGRSIDQYRGFGEDAILKIGSYHGRAVTGTPLLGVFNTRQHRLAEIIPLARFPGVIDSMRYIVRSHSSGLVSAVIESSSPNALLKIALDLHGCDILTAYTVTQFESETNGRIYAANLGLVDKMTGAAAIVTNHFELLPTGKVFVDARFKALGIFGLYVSSLSDMSVDRDFMVTIQGLPIPFHTVTLDPRDSCVLNIDIETAWREMELSSGWSNEVEVKVYFDVEHP